MGELYIQSGFYKLFLRTIRPWISMNFRTFFIMHSSHNFQHAKDLPVRNVASYPESIYISIDFVEKYKNGLSGKYIFHSMDKDASEYFPTYIREQVPVPGFAANMKFFLCRKKGSWCISFEAVKSGKQSPIFKILTTGKFLSIHIKYVT